MQRRERRNTGARRGVQLSRREFITTTTLSLLALAQPGLARGHGGHAHRSQFVSAGHGIPASGKTEPDALQKLAAKLHGYIITPSDAYYDAARQVWNARFDRRPGAIVRCADADDVARTIEFARKYNIEAAVRSGGHSQAGFSTIDGGIVIDLSEMKRVEVDPVWRLARAQPGITRVEFERATQRHGLVTAMGQCQDVGLGGLVLGGGEGVLAGKYGAACDNVLEAEIVLADGRIVRASRSDNPDLLWGTCGGAGNLGVVTELSFQLYPLREATAGWFWYPFAQARDVMRGYRDFTRSTPDELTTELTVMRPEGPELMVGIFVFHADPARASRSGSTLQNRPRRARLGQAPGLSRRAGGGGIPGRMGMVELSALRVRADDHRLDNRRDRQHAAAGRGGAVVRTYARRDQPQADRLQRLPSAPSRVHLLGRGRLGGPRTARRNSVGRSNLGDCPPRHGRSLCEHARRGTRARARSVRR